MEVPIVAARTVDSEEGNLLILWVRQEPEEFEEIEDDMDFDDPDTDW